MRGLCAMGFGRGEAAAALRRAHDQPDRAAELLIAQAESVHERGRHGARLSAPQRTGAGVGG